MSISIPRDVDGRVARECPSDACSPGYFKVKLGTGIAGEQQTGFCPYCRQEAAPNDFATKEQIRYAKDIVVREAERGVSDMVREALGLGPTGRKRMGGGLISMELSYKPGTPRSVRSPYEEEVRRDVVCPHCALDQTVFGLATWCSDCGTDIFLVHVSAEIAVTKLMLEDVERRGQSLGRRVAMKDVENCLEDAVSIFEASTKALVRRKLTQLGRDEGAIEAEMKRAANSFQSIERSKEHLQRLFAYSPSEPERWTRLGVCFEKRHPVTHNLGVVDKKYLERTKQQGQDGREVRISQEEVLQVLSDVYGAISDAHSALVGTHADP